jgi:hypothetical protein
MEYMKRTIVINEGVIMGEYKKSIIEILPQLETSFKQRKQYFEYYFDETQIEITLGQLDMLSDRFRLVVSWETIIIEV